MESMKEKPIQFIAYENEKWFVTKEAKNILRNISTPVSIIGIVGRYRSGKSYLLNRLFSSQQGFDLGSTTEGCTRGIWLWGRPSTSEGRTVILMDTEGLKDIKNQDEGFDAKLFSLTVLLTSYMVLNTVNVIDESSIRELSDHIQTSANADEEETGADYDKHFPDFLWVVRDFALQKSLSDDAYLEDALKSKPGSKPALVEANNLRQVIRDMFKKRNCITLVRPVETEDKLQRLGDIPEKDIRPEFLQKVNELASRVLKEAPLKTIYSPENKQVMKLDGKGFLHLAELYVESINKGVVPNISNAWESVSRAACEKALNIGLDHYHTQMKTIEASFPISFEELSKRHEEIYKESVELFHNTSMGGEVQEEYLTKLSDTIIKTQGADEIIGGIFFTFVQQNMSKSEAFCSELIQKELKAVQDAKHASFEEVKNILLALDKKYINTARGPAAPKVRSNFEMYIRAFEKEQMLAFKLEEAERLIVEQKQKAREMENKLKQQYEEGKKAREQLEMLIEKNKLEVQEMIAKKEKEMSDYKAKTEADLKKREEEMNKALSQGKKDLAEMYEGQMKELKSEMKDQDEQRKQELSSLKEKMSQAQHMSKLKELKEAESALICRLQDMGADQYSKATYTTKKQETPQCGAATKNGAPCKRKVSDGGRCYQH